MQFEDWFSKVVYEIKERLFGRIYRFVDNSQRSSSGGGELGI